VAADSKASVKGKFIEILGFYDPINKKCEFKKDRIDHWKSVGSQLSETVAKLVEKGGKVELKKKTKPNKKSILREQKAKEEAEAPKEEVVEEVKEEAPAEEVSKEEVKEEASAEETSAKEVKEETPAEETKDEK
jgi:small subunit ribosomal protein S16